METIHMKSNNENSSSIGNTTSPKKKLTPTKSHLKISKQLIHREKDSDDDSDYSLSPVISPRKRKSEEFTLEDFTIVTSEDSLDTPKRRRRGKFSFKETNEKSKLSPKLTTGNTKIQTPNTKIVPSISTSENKIPSFAQNSSKSHADIDSFKLKVWSKYFGGGSDATERPCPACCQVMSTDNMNFEVQSITGADLSDMGLKSEVHEFSWNFIPLCSRDESHGWGCSERLERERLEADDDSENLNEPIHIFDWLLREYPQRMHEVCIRLQMGYGDAVSMPAGDTLCLRFIRDVYSTTQTFPQTVPGLDISVYEKHIFKGDLLDIAECFSEHTDREMLSIIDMKKKLMTPIRSFRRTPNSIHRSATYPAALSTPSRGNFMDRICDDEDDICSERSVSPPKSTTGENDVESRTKSVK
mmetsp:Transcript_10713/g.16235  ORF Transcript_10713/g.16235 Transcript_10713/m.16235 type:complete len:414 (-) Transcript_10713:141-1382(-)